MAEITITTQSCIAYTSLLSLYIYNSVISTVIASRGESRLYLMSVIVTNNYIEHHSY